MPGETKKRVHYLLAKPFIAFLIIGLLIGFHQTPALGKVGTQGYPGSFAELIKKASPSVVNIIAVKVMRGSGEGPSPFGMEDPLRDFFEKFFGGQMPKEYRQNALGTGFVIDKEGFILTNNHVVEQTEELKVRLSDEKEFKAQIVGRDPKTDLALIKINSERPLVPLVLGDSDRVDVGDWVVAIGNPFGLGNTVTAGIVSAKYRQIGGGPYDNFIQTDASINPGNSGGPLLNLNGEVIGINTAIVASGQGIGFAIPVNLVKGIIVALKTEGEVTRGWLGVAIQDLSSEMAEYYGIKSKEGVFVADVFEGDPADKAGIKPKDIILEINGQKIKTSRQLTSMIAGVPVGESAKIKILRDGNEKTVKVKIVKRDETKLASRARPKEQAEEFGIRVSNITPEIAQQLNIAETSGVIVTEIESGSKGEAADIRVGDIIKEINRRPLEAVTDYQEILSQVDSGEAVNLFIRRKNAGFLVVKLTK